MKLSFLNIFIVCASLLMSVSCAQELNLGGVQSDQVGYLEVPDLYVDLELISDMETKASVALPEGLARPSLEDFTWSIKDSEGNVLTKDAKENSLANLKASSWPSPLVLPIGSYTLVATAGSNALGQPYFVGEKGFEIAAASSTTVTDFKASLANAVVTFSLPSDIATHYVDLATTLQAGSATMSAQSGSYYYVPSGVEVSVKLSGKSSAGVDKTLSLSIGTTTDNKLYSVAFSMSLPTISFDDVAAGAFEGRLYFKAASATNVSPGNADKLSYQIKGGVYSDWQNIADVQALTLSSFTKDSQDYLCLKGLANGTSYSIRPVIGNVVGQEKSFTYNPVSLASCVSASATAAHTTNDVGELNGTQLTSTYTVSGIPTLAAELITLTASGSTKSGETVMSSHSIDLNESGDTESVDHNNRKNGWPYIPQGTYANASTVTCTFPEGGTATVSASITVPAPTFTVTLLKGSYTSYDKYAATNDITKNITEANKCNAETLYELGSSWTISQDLMTNTNYSKVLRFYDGTTVKKEVNTFSATQHTEQSLTGLTWGAHTVKATVTFDGVEIASGTRTHHITGLPYSAAPPKDSGTNPWIDSKGNNTWTDDCVQLYYSAAKYPRIISPTFNIPQDINVDVSTKIYREYYWSSVARGPIKVYQYNSTSKKEKSIYDARLSREETLETKWSITMSSTYNAYYIEYEYAADTGKTNVYYFNVLYR